MIDYHTAEDAKSEVADVSETESNLHGGKNSRWHSVSHARMDLQHDGTSQVNHGMSHGGHYHHHDHGILHGVVHEHHHSGKHHMRQQKHDDYRFTSHHYSAESDNGHHGIDRISKYSDDDDDEEDDEDDDYDEEPPKQVGLFGLFKYSTKWDIVLVILGCLGALINGGALPWYSYLFGNFVNKLSKDDKSQMMKDVEKVHFFTLCFLK